MAAPLARACRLRSEYVDMGVEPASFFLSLNSELMFHFLFTWVQLPTVSAKTLYSMLRRWR